MLKIGIGKADITAFYEDAGMLGYAMYFHIMRGVESPLNARAYVFENEANKVCFVNCELCFITPSIKTGVLRQLTENHPHLNYTDQTLMISAQHTHCAPGGYSHYPLYNTSIPGYIDKVYEKIVTGIVSSILNAENNKQLGIIKIGRSSFAKEQPVSFNRSIKAYNRNPEVKQVTFENRHLATDREMVLLQFESEEGEPLGSINWFAVHTTNLPNNFLKISADNKGFASTYLEEDMESTNANYTAAFAQGACGDVSARYIYNSKHPFTRGKYEGKFPDDVESSKYNGHLQFEKAKDIIKNIKNNEDAGNQVDAAILYTDFGNIDIDPKFTDGKNDCLTSPSCMGVAFLEGSKYDGPGMHPIVGFFARGLSKSIRAVQLATIPFRNDNDKKAVKRKVNAQGTKSIVLESSKNTIFSARHPKRFIIPGFIDETIRNLKLFDELGAYNIRPFTPQVLPVQMIQLGNIAICGIPFEITTVASWRLKKTIEDILLNNDKGIEHIILAPYSNAYSGYITTYEEYQQQDYEGGHCVFGQWSLNALQQQCYELSQQLLKPQNERNDRRSLLPPELTDEELYILKHFKSNYVKKLEKKRRKPKAIGG